MRCLLAFLILFFVPPTFGQNKTDTTILVLQIKRHVKAYDPNGKTGYDYIYASPQGLFFIYGEAPDEKLNQQREVKFFYEGVEYLAKKSDLIDLSFEQWETMKTWTRDWETTRRSSAEKISKQLKLVDSLSKEKIRLKSLIAVNNAIISGLVFMWSWNEDGEYVKSQGFNFEIMNTLKKKIKYVYVDIALYNPVGDLISKKNLTLIGPIEYSQKSSYSFENVFYSRVAESAKVLAVKVQYFDGTIKLYNGANLKKIRVSSSDYETFLEDSKRNIE